MNCPKCKNPISSDARFCGLCGQRVEAEAPVARMPPIPPAASVAAASPGGTSTATPIAGAGASWSIAGILNRMKNMLLTPKTEWQVIVGEPMTIPQLYMGYVVPLTAWTALIGLVRVALIGTRLPFSGAVRMPLSGAIAIAAWTFAGSFIGLFLVGLIVSFLAPTFGGTRDQTRGLKVAVYSLTPAYLGSVLALSPVLPSLLQFAVLCYGLYVLYLGLPVVMQAPKDRALGYTATVVVCCFVLGFVVMLVTAGLGIFAGSAGLLGAHTASKAASADQSAAILGNGVGDMLGTDAKGKAGITAAVANLIKAGEQNAATASTPPADDGPTDAPAADRPAAGAQDAGAAVGGLLGALGGALGGDHPKTVVDFKSLTPLLPADLPGMKRISVSGESQGAIGIKTASATGTYQGTGGTVKVEITDMSAVSGLMGMAGALVQNTGSESETGFERDQVIGARSAHEKYDAISKHGDVKLMVAKRYQVEVTGDGPDMNTLEHVLGRVDFARLEAMRDQGSKPR
jgi:hypothetical protein